MKKILASSLLTFAFFLLPSLCKAQYTDLHNFNDTAGANPHGSLLLSGNKFYGMTLNGGKFQGGCVFSMDTNGGNYTVLHNLSDTVGEHPFGGLTQAGDVLFGVTNQMGLFGYGSIFSIHTDGSRFKVLFYFQDTTGQNPVGTLVRSGRTLYGMTENGGLQHDSGCIFSIDTSGLNYTNLLDFKGTNGFFPWGSLILSGNRLYGMTQDCSFGQGLIFAINTNGSVFTKLLIFNGYNGGVPQGNLTLYGGKLFGLTKVGGTHSDGIIFSIDTTGAAFKDMYDFDGLTGKNPEGSLTPYANTLVGMTYTGGAHDSGLVFSIDTATNFYEDLFDFNSGVDNGGLPTGDITISGNYLYGMTTSSGRWVNGYNGVIFRLKDTLALGIDALKSLYGNAIVYPNPSNGKFTIKVNSEQLKTVSIKVYNVLGEQVYSQLSNFNSETSINLSGQPTGVYLYKVVATNGELIGEGKLIIQK